MEPSSETDPEHSDFYSKLLRKDSALWTILHKVTKPIVRGGIETAGRMVQPIADEKQNKGWINPEVALLYSHLTEVIDKDVLKWREQNNFPNSDYIMLCRLRDLMCVMLDEDSHYLLRFFYLLEVMFRDQPQYRIEMHKQRAYWDWEAIMEGIKRGDPKWLESRTRT